MISSKTDPPPESCMMANKTELLASRIACATSVSDTSADLCGEKASSTAGLPEAFVIEGWPRDAPEERGRLSNLNHWAATGEFLKFCRSFHAWSNACAYKPATSGSLHKRTLLAWTYNPRMAKLAEPVRTLIALPPSPRLWRPGP